MSTQETKLQTIANAIRAKEGSSALIQANDFAARILALQTVGGSSDLCRINLLSTDVNGGTVHGGGIASKNMSVNVSVTVNDGYYFEGWTENGAVISEDKEITLSVQKDRNLIANVFAIQYSLGVDWLQAALPSAGAWTSITYGNEKFVALASSSDNKIAYSTDGINWVIVGLTGTGGSGTGGWICTTYGGGKFVILCGSSKSEGLYSTNGINWTATTLPTTAYWSSVTYGNGKFVAVAQGSNKGLYSTDGINWTATTLPSSGYWRSVAYGGGKFVTVANDSNKGLYSTDGINWAETTLPSSANSSSAYYYSVTYGNGKFVVVERGSSKGLYSTDGINWTATTLPSYRYWQAVAYGGGKFVVLGTDQHISYSTDGINWTETTLPVSGNWLSVAYGGGKFVALSNGTNKVVYSQGGSTVS